MEFEQFEDTLIFPVPDISELNTEEIETIVAHTHNTWQHDRPVSEIRENTIQGKRAELVVEYILREKTEWRYLSYDSIRTDNYEKHAPFDGVIYKASLDPAVLKNAFDRINRDVMQDIGDYGRITVATRKFLEDSGVFTVEIKSSLLQHPRDYRTMAHKDDYGALCKYIKGFYDYFVYPHYCRDNARITCFYAYAKYVRRMNSDLSSGKPVKAFVKELMKTEFDNACNIYTRVFFDVRGGKMILPGYTTKSRFFEEPRVQKMWSQKSKDALYYMYHMSLGKGLLEIDGDEELQNWDRERLYANLFGVKTPVCPTCGNALKLVESSKNPDRRRHKFLYLCQTCTTDKWYRMNQIHSQNMKDR